MTPEEIEAARIERRIERDREARRAERALKALPLPTDVPATPEFAPLESEPEAQLRMAEQAYEAVKERLPVAGQEGESVARERARLEAERLGAVTSIQPGKVRASTEVGTYILPTFRSTRIRRVDPDARFAEDPATASPEEMSDKQLDVAILASAEGTPRLRELTVESDLRERQRTKALRATPTPELIAGQAPRAPSIEGERLYLDPATGKLRQPTAGEEVTEAFAKQTVMSEAAAKAAADRISTASKELERRVAAGEDVSWYEAAGPYFSGILSTRDELGAGTTETELGATLRAGLGTLSVLAAEGYFRGLGYEVDRNGVPKDPNDFGLAVAQVREKLGLTEIINPLGALEEPLRAAAGKISPELAQQAVDALRSIPQLAIPLPGVATQGTEQGPTSMDPEGRRRVSGIEVPSVLEDPQGFYEAETRRLARSLAGGRTMADEFLDSPATRRWYANVYGDPDAAFWAGAVGDVFIPAGPGTLARAAKGLGKAAAGSKAAGAAAAATINAAEALRGTRAGALVSPAADFAAAITKGAPSDGRVVRRVAEKSINTMNVPEAKRAAARQAIGGTSNTIDEVRQDVGAANIFTQAEFDYFNRTFIRNVPDDMVMVTDRVAVPRVLGPKWKAEAQRVRQEVLLRPVAEVRAQLDAVNAASPAYANDLRNMYRIIDNAKGRALSVSERQAINKEWDKLVAKFGAPLDRKQASRLYLRRPKDLDPGYTDEDWTDIPAASVERLLNDRVDSALLRAIPQEARLATDLTSAQVAVRDYGTALEKLLGDSQTARRLRATLQGPMFGGLRQESIASAATRKQIQAAGQTAIREEGAAIARRAKRLGSFEAALDAELAKRLNTADVPAAEAWDKALEAIYGNPELAKSVKASAFADASNLPAGITRAGASRAVEFADYPTVAALKAVDRLYARSGKFLTNNFTTEKLWGALLPNYEKALLKVFLEEGVKKRLAQAAMESDEYRGAIDFLANPTLDAKLAQAEAEAFAEAVKLGTRDPSLAKVELRATVPNAFAVRLYDPAASDVERRLAANGEELFVLAEGVDPRLRADIGAMASQGRDWAIANLAKNLENAVKYGYYLPNIPYIAMKLFSIPIVSVVTSGLSRTGQASEQFFRRQVNGGGLQLPDGRYLSPSDLEYEYRFHGLGLTEVESTRVGALADDLIRDGERAAAQGRGAVRGAGRLAFDVLSPFSRTVGQRLAHSLELSFRRATFEARLLAGDSFEVAAEAARRSVLDYSASPDFVRNLVGKYVAEASSMFQLSVELLRFGSENTAVSRAFAKANSERAKAEDPYGVYGDRALKSLGIIGVGESTYYLPSIGRVYAPFELGLAAVRNGNQMVAAAARASEVGGAEVEGALLSSVVEEGLEVTRTGLNAVLPALSAALDAAIEASGASDQYLSADVPDAKPMGDAQAFWAAAVIAHHGDLDRKNGDWDFFLSVFQPEFVLPGKDQAAYPGTADNRRRYWKSRPEGMPYLVWGDDAETGETIYVAIQPSNIGLMNVGIIRAIPGLRLSETLGVVSAALIEEHEKASAPPVELRPEGVLPRLDLEAPERALGFVLGQAPSVEDERRRQALELAAARGKTE
jgi:hypothetical protein